jgi:hypothetical protein
VNNTNKIATRLNYAVELRRANNARGDATWLALS